MPATKLTAQSSSPTAGLDFIALIQQGQVAHLIRFIVEPTDDGERVRTLVIGKPMGSRTNRFPLVSVVEHPDDQSAMDYALRLFSAMKAAGRATSEDVATWRRSLFAVVPSPSLS